MKALISTGLLIVVAGVSQAGKAPGALDVPPTAIVRATVAFPELAETQGIQGLAELRVIVDADGTVVAAETLSEEPSCYGFGAVAIDAVKASRYESGRAGSFNSTFRFRVDGLMPLEEYRVLPRVLERVDDLGPPAMPPQAASAAVRGYVDLAVDIDGDGRPGKMTLVNAVPGGLGFEAAAFNAVLRWRFRSGTKAATYALHIEFGLDRSPTATATADNLRCG